MLFVTVFTFIGLPTAQTMVSFSDTFDSYELFLDLTSEEENESSKEETKELKDKLINEQHSLAVFRLNQLSLVALHDHPGSCSTLVYEVQTPPPE